jgi:hypothetical protein
MKPMSRLRSATRFCAQDGRQQVFRDGGACADEQRPSKLSAHLLQPEIELRRHAENALGVFQCEVACGSERDAPVPAIEQAGVEMLLELANLERDRRLGHEQRLGRLGERKMLGDRVEHLEAAIRHLSAEG